MDPAPLATFGSQRQPAWGIALTVATAVMAAVTFWFQFGAVAAASMLVLGVLGAIVTVRNRDQPCYTVEPEQLVQHLGRRRKCHPWVSLRRPVRRKHLALEDWIEVGHGKGRLLLRLSGLAEDERTKLFEVVQAAVHAAAKTDGSQPPVAAASGASPVGVAEGEPESATPR